MISNLAESTMINFSYGPDPLQATILDYSPLPSEESHNKQFAIFTNLTNFHPVDYRWSDQPADTGEIIFSNHKDIQVCNCLIAAKQAANETLYFDKTIPVRRGDEGWLFFVAHIINQDARAFLNDNIVGQKVLLSVDQTRRLALSAGHSACHLAALALNKTLTRYWQENHKARLDSLGHPDLDSLAIKLSKILPFASEDTYRFGKTLRKTGFQTVDAINDIRSIEELINEQLKTWLDTNPTIAIEPMPSKISDRRWWHCLLPEGKASIPCGGTHLSNFNHHDKIGTINVRLSQSDDNEMMMRTTISI